MKLHDPASNALDVATHLWTEKEAERPKQWQIPSCRGESNGFCGVGFRHCRSHRSGSADPAETSMERADLPELEPGVLSGRSAGLRVLTTDGERVGVVQEVMTVGAQPQLVIARPPRESALIPAIPEFFGVV